MIKTIWITIFFGITSLNSYSQKLNVNKLDSLLNALEEKELFMGNIAISSKGKLIYSKSIGKTDIATNKNSSYNTRYRIGSTSKVFTSALVLKSIENNKLTLNQSIGSFFPSNANSEKITIEMLLKHRSGIAEFLKSEEFANGYTEAKTEDEMIAIISKQKSDFDPNSKAEYSNSNYYLLTIILEKLYQKSYSNILDEQIIKPLRLKNTYFGSKLNLQNNECYSYYFTDKWEKDTEGDTSVPLGAGGLVSNAIDLTVFIKKLFMGKVITFKSLKTMTHIQDKYGMGIFELPFHDKKGFMHRGSIDSFGSVITYFPADELAIAITSNGATYDKKKVLIATLSNYFNKPYKIKFEPFKPSSEDLEKYLGTYMSLSYPGTIVITRNNTNILAGFSDKSVLTLEPVEKDKFENLWESNKIEFNPSMNEMIFEENGQKFIFSKL